MAAWRDLPPHTPSRGSFHRSLQMAGLVGKDEDGNLVWVRQDGPHSQLPNLSPAPAPAILPDQATCDESAHESEVEVPRQNTGAPCGDEAEVGTAESSTTAGGSEAAEGPEGREVEEKGSSPTVEPDPFDEDEALLAGLEEEAEEEAEAADAVDAAEIAISAGLVGKDERGNPIWVRGDGPHAGLPGLSPAPVLPVPAQPARPADKDKEVAREVDSGQRSCKSTMQQGGGRTHGVSQVSATPSGHDDVNRVTVDGLNVGYGNRMQPQQRTLPQHRWQPQHQPQLQQRWQQQQNQHQHQQQHQRQRQNWQQPPVSVPVPPPQQRYQNPAPEWHMGGPPSPQWSWYDSSVGGALAC
eukprot:COSAG01_NODE_408_length_17382_cov_6.231431_2_plen_354_part_00